jgi:predicted small lipoprotein YifL
MNLPAKPSPRRRSGRAALLLLALAAALATSACGKKGDPTLPAGESDKYPRTYPNANQQ